MNVEFEITEETPDRRYYTITPNLVEDMNLSPYAYRLYGRIKRRAGENGTCWENSRHLAEGCHMSRTQISRAKEELERAGLIKIETRSLVHGHFPGHIITIVNIWKKNVDYYDNKTPVPHRDTSCPPGSPRPVPEVVHKNNPINKGEGEEDLNDWQPQLRSSPSEAKNASSVDEGNNRAAYYRKLNNHQTISDIKKLIGFLPPQLIRERIIKTFPDGLDMVRAKNTIERWVASGYDPNNFDGWLFDKYLNGYYYNDHPENDKRWNEIQHPGEKGAETIEDTK